VTKQKTNKDTNSIRYLIQQRLEARMQDKALTGPSEEHLDEDTMSAFIEGRVGESGSSIIVSHLIVCPDCRGASAQLLRLESQFDDESYATTPNDTPSRLRVFLEGLAAHVIPSSGEDVVFAYQDPSPDKTPGEATQETDSDEEPEKK